jgi:hypothetical protein
MYVHHNIYRESGRCCFFPFLFENKKRQAVTAEFLGTLLLTFVGCGSLDDAAELGRVVEKFWG